MLDCVLYTSFEVENFILINFTCLRTGREM